MQRAPIRVLAVDDDEETRQSIKSFLDALGYLGETVSSGQAALERLGHSPVPDVVLLDVVMRDLDGIETLKRYRQNGGAVPIVMISGNDDGEIVIQAMRLGAADYLTKPLARGELSEIIERVVELKPMRAGTSTSVIEGTEHSRQRLGVSPAMLRVEALLDRVADVDVPILITGESGVGKDVVARAIHARSSRHARVFVKINCAALPENLLESELFGYERGAFTGAQRAKPGQFELADGGTLFLDEIGEVPAQLQAKLLQALQDGEFYRVGGQRKVRVDVRILVATNRDLERAIRDGSFREDLYYRLNVVHLRIPALRERREDIPGLLALFVDKYGRRYGRGGADVPPDVVKRFLSYDWPGNVRELENLVRRLMVLRDPSYVYAEMRGPPGAAGKESARDHASEATMPDSLPIRPREEASGNAAVALLAGPQDLALGAHLPGGEDSSFTMHLQGDALLVRPSGDPLVMRSRSEPVAPGETTRDTMHAPGETTHAPGETTHAPGETTRDTMHAPGETTRDTMHAPGDTTHAPGDQLPLRLPDGQDSASRAPSSSGLLPFSPRLSSSRGGSYPFGGYASDAAATPIGEVVAAEFANVGEEGHVDLKALGRKAADIVEREAIVAMLARTGGSKREAAVRLGISYKAILYKIRGYGIGRPRVVRTAKPTDQ